MSLFSTSSNKEASAVVFTRGLSLEAINIPIAELIERRRLQILVHSRIYYSLDQNLIEDKLWDKWARELVNLQLEYPELSANICFAEAFKDWDASSGAFLPLDDEWVVFKANQLIKNSYSKVTKKAATNIVRSIQPSIKKTKKVETKKTGGLF